MRLFHLELGWLGRFVKLIVVVVVVALSSGILFNFRAMYMDLFYMFPQYGAKPWSYGIGNSIKAMKLLENQFDDVSLASAGLNTSIYLLFYTQYDPVQRQAELAQKPDRIWQNIGNYNIGNVRSFIQNPGCHLISTSKPDAEDIKRRFPLLVTLDEDAGYGVYALPVPSSTIEKNFIFDQHIILQGFASVSPSEDDVSLRPGQAICLIIQWQALHDIHTDYTVFVHLTGPINSVTGSSLWAQHDSLPVFGEKPTSAWRAGDIIQDAHILTTPTEMPLGQYSLEVGLYDSATGKRLPVLLEDGSSGSSLILMNLDVRLDDLKSMDDE